MLTSSLEIAGFTLIAIGFGMAWLPLGFIAGGTLLALTAYLAARGEA